MPAPSSRRTLAIWLPRLSTDRVAVTWLEAASRPFATVATQKSALRLASVNEAAARLGLQPGLTLADARARHPDLRVTQADEAADAALLKALGERCERYTPLVALDPPDGLMLDITGAAHLFGGEAAMRRDAARRIAREGFAVRVAIAETPGCAWALARFGEEAVVATGGAREALMPLPLAALRLPAEMLAGLRRVGLVRIADIVALPRAPLTARFGADLLLRLDQALGRHEEALTHLRPASPFTAERIFAEPIEQEDAILATAEALAIGLGPPMERGEVGARRLELALFRVDGKVDRLVVGTSRPARDARLIRRLFAETLAKIGEIDAGYGFDVVRLSVRATEPLPAHQLALGQSRSFEADLALLIDRLAARLGPRRLIRLAPHDSHVPERAVATCSPSPLEGEGCAELARLRAYSKLGEGSAASLLAEAQQEESFTACRPTPSPHPSPSREEGGIRGEAEDTSKILVFAGREDDTKVGGPRPLMERARRLRRNQTDVERKLWNALRRHQIETAKFRRQQPIGRYVVDFLCSAARLVVELDGGQHGDQVDAARDRARTKWLQARGYRVLRFWNNEVSENVAGVLEVIRNAVLEFKSRSAIADKCADPATNSPSPLEGEGCAGLARLRAYPELGEGSAAPAVKYPVSAFTETHQESFPACRPTPSPHPSPSRGEGGMRGEAEFHGCAEAATNPPSPLEGEGCGGLARSRAYSKLGEGSAAPAVKYPVSAFTETQEDSFPACRPNPSPQPSPSRGEGGDRGEAGERRKAGSAVVISFAAASLSQLKPESRRQSPPSPGYSGPEFAELSLIPHPASARRASPPSLHNPESSPGQALPPQGCVGDELEDDSAAERPIRLFEPPESVEAMAEVPDGAPLRFRWRRKLHRVLHAEGPERIALEWWRDAASPGFTRDYFRIETTEGRRFWLYRDGLYAREVSHPRWFVHGVFA